MYDFLRYWIGDGGVALVGVVICFGVTAFLLDRRGSHEE